MTNEQAVSSTVPNYAVMAEWLDEAHDIIRQYQQYGEAMREFGRGFSPTTAYSVDTVCAAVRAIAQQQRQAAAVVSA